MKLIHFLSYGIKKFKHDKKINHEKIKNFKKEMANKDNQYGEYWKLNIESIFKKVKFKEEILKYYGKDYKSNILEYTSYKQKFVNKTNIENGLFFWKKYKTILKKSETPPEIIVSIIGIETKYGDFLGNYSIFNSLYTLAFNINDITGRSTFFLNELKYFMNYCKKNKYISNKKIFNLKGSFAGAMGLPQFMPSSIANYAVDGNKDNKIDLFTPEDAIKSVDNYLIKNKWNKKEEKIITKKDGGKALELNKYDYKDPNQCKDKFIILDNKKYFVSNNFCVLKKYNNSNFYAMAVYELAEKIKNKFQQEI